MLRSSPLVICLLCFTLSCTDEHGPSETKTKNKTALEKNLAGLYRGPLKPVQKDLSPKLKGSVTLVKEGNELIATIRVSHAPASVLLTQTLHEGTRCPEMRDDENGDGLIDAEEAYSAHRGTLIPLDDDLSSLPMGLGIFPVTDEFGTYLWSRAVSYEKLMADLWEEDFNPEDDFVKLPHAKSFSPERLVVMLSGANPESPLPSTVRGRGRLTPQQSFPLACAVLVRDQITPGTIDSDETVYPIPQGGNSGGVAGGDDGADFPEQGGTTGGNYGEEDTENYETRVSEL